MFLYVLFYNSDIIEIHVVSFMKHLCNMSFLDKWFLRYISVCRTFSLCLQQSIVDFTIMTMSPTYPSIPRLWLLLIVCALQWKGVFDMTFMIFFFVVLSVSVYCVCRVVQKDYIFDLLRRNKRPIHMPPTKQILLKWINKQTKK